MSSNTIRCYPPGGVATAVTINSPVNGIIGYSATANSFVDAQVVDAPSLNSNANGFLTPALAGSGTTAGRPPAANWKGQFYVDTTLGVFIWSDGTIWRTVAGAAA